LGQWEIALLQAADQFVADRAGRADDGDGGIAQAHGLAPLIVPEDECQESKGPVRYRRGLGVAAMSLRSTRARPRCPAGGLLRYHRALVHRTKHATMITAG